MCRDIDSRVMEIFDECIISKKYGEEALRKKVSEYVNEISTYLIQLGIIKLLINIPSIKEISKGIYVSSNGMISPELVNNIIILGEMAQILYINPGQKVINVPYSSLI